MYLILSAELNGSVSPPVTVFKNPASVPETLSIRLVPEYMKNVWSFALSALHEEDAFEKLPAPATVSRLFPPNV